MALLDIKVGQHVEIPLSSDISVCLLLSHVGNKNQYFKLICERNFILTKASDKIEG